MNVNTKYVLAVLIGALALECIIPSTIGIAAYAQQQPQTQSIPGQFVANLSGKNVFPPVNTNATGQASLNLTNQGSKMAYLVSAHNLNGVTSATLEFTQGGRTREVASLYDAVKSGPTGKIDGTLTQGTFGASDLLTDFKGKQLSNLIKAMTDGNIVLRVRTISLPQGVIEGKVTPNIS
ncbi:MAG: CHRD domain-containing protein [Nitrososphaeraceae archaeon]